MSNKQSEVWYFKRQPKRAITVQLDKRLLLTGLFSILLHVAIVWLFAPKLFSVGTPQPDAPKTLNITLAPPQKEEIAGVEPSVPAVQEIVVPEKPPAIPKPKPKPKPKKKPQKQSKPLPVKSVAESPIKVPEKVDENQAQEKQQQEKQIEVVEKKPAPVLLPGEDMQAYVQRQKMARLEKQGFSQQDAAEFLANNSPKSGGTSRDATIRKNLDLDGTNGIFQIRYINLNHAEFSFKGWKNNVNTARLEVFQVEAADHQNIRLAVIRKMIEIIRRDYSGDFNWVSQRSRETIVLSARVEDTASLESYLMREFFGAGTQYRRYP